MTTWLESTREYLDGFIGSGKGELPGDAADPHTMTLIGVRALVEIAAELRESNARIAEMSAQRPEIEGTMDCPLCQRDPARVATCRCCNGNGVIGVYPKAEGAAGVNG